MQLGTSTTGGWEVRKLMTSLCLSLHKKTSVLVTRANSMASGDRLTTSARSIEMHASPCRRLVMRWPRMALMGPLMEWRIPKAMYWKAELPTGQMGAAMRSASSMLSPLIALL